MTPDSPGYNDPCPCGSGRKYGHCCLLKKDTAPPESGSDTGGVFADLRRELASRTFDSMEDLQDFADHYMEQRNRAALDDFHGLSPDQMSALLYAPFDTPRLVTFPEPIGITPEAPILTLFQMLADAIGERGLKCTVKGNLPRAFCREAAENFREHHGQNELSRSFRINTETDFTELHVMRLVARMAGLVRKRHDRFKLTRECRKLLDNAGPSGVYPRLFRTYVQRYNWAYADGYPELPFIQQSFLFTLYLLHRYGAEERPHTFYENAYLQAFPVLLEQVKPRPYSTPEQQLRNCYTLRTIVRFAGFLGLGKVENASKDIMDKDYRITKMPLLEETVHFLM